MDTQRDAKLQDAWSEDDFGVHMADKAADECTDQWRQGRYMEHLGNLNSTDILADLQGRSLTWAAHRGNHCIRPIKEIVTVETSYRYRRRRDKYREEDKLNPRPP